MLGFRETWFLQHEMRKSGTRRSRGPKLLKGGYAYRSSMLDVLDVCERDRCLQLAFGCGLVR